MTCLPAETVHLIRQEPYPLFRGKPGQGMFNPCVLDDPRIGKIRMVIRKTSNDGTDFRSGQYLSSVTYAQSHDGRHFRHFLDPLITPDQPYENAMGCEDATIQAIDEYFMFYTAVGGREKKEPVIRIALATSRDFCHWEKHGIIGPNVTSKSAVLFPEKINDQYVLLYTAYSDSPRSTIMQTRFNNLVELINPPAGFMDANLADSNNIVLAPTPRARRGPEVGAPPIKTVRGWLLVYCGENSAEHDEWTINAMLLDLENPGRIIGRLKEPLLRPSHTVDSGPVCINCVFPKGAIQVEDQLFVYHGTGDNGCALSSCNINRLLASFED